MASVGRIEQDINGLYQAIDSLAEEFRHAYSDYLQAFGQALAKQLILSGYHVCTRGYPTQFLALSLNQRQMVQQALRELAKQSQARLVTLVPPIALSNPDLTPSSNVGESLDQSAFTTQSQESPITTPDRPQTVDQLIDWCNTLETAIVHELITLSFKANTVLLQAKILPSSILQFLQATGSQEHEPATPSPNAMQLLTASQPDEEEDSDDPDDEESASEMVVVQLVAVHLKQSDVEFSDGTTTLLRNRLRSLAARLKTLKQTVRKKEKELAIAQAETAWRSSWYED